MRSRQTMTALLCALFLGFHADGANAYICWIEKVEKSELGAKVFLYEKYRYAVRSIKRRSDGSSEQPKSPEYFELQEGDVARLSTWVHDWCTVTAEHRGDSFGIQVEANSRPHGSPLSKAFAFIEAKK